VARAGHGGAILLLPDDNARLFLEHDWLRIKYPTDDKSIWEAMRVAIRRYDEKSIAQPGDTQFDAAESKTQRLLSRLARLAAVDGAVVLTDRFRLLGFGAEVTIHEAVDSVMRADGSIVPSQDFGTRHRSAFRFCSFYPAGLALVCSQDGGVKCIRKVSESVRLYE
jgi:hypothetical protein